MPRFQNMVVFITGASSGIGEALAREFVREGAAIVLTARRLDRLEALAAELNWQGGQALALACDVTRDGEIEAALTKARERFGSIDVVVANAGNAGTVSDALAERLAGTRAVLDDHSLATGLVALQGPRSVDVLAPLTDVDLGSLRYYAIADGHVAGIPAQVARTGYTGEDGFEVFVDWARTGELWDALLEPVRGAGGGPVGLGARDTLRLEAGMPLYGNELDLATTPFDAGLGRVVKLDKPADFVGRAALEKAALDGPKRRLVGLVVEGRGIARHGYPVHVGERRTGIVTSGTQSPTLGVPIAMAYVTPADAEPDTMVDIEIRAARVPARVVPLPFYRRSS